MSDQLPDFAKHRFENHIRRCVNCARLVNEYQQAAEMFCEAVAATRVESSLQLKYKLETMATKQVKPEQRRLQTTILIIGLIAILISVTSISIFGVVAIKFSIIFFASLLLLSLSARFVFQKARKSP